MNPSRRSLIARVLLLPAVLLSACTTGMARTPNQTEILWDKYGVPHIFASTREGMFHAHGWAQMRNQANLLLKLYGESRGRAAEYWGQEYAALDRWLAINGMPERAKQWYDAQTPTFRTYMDEFARGINDYAAAHPETIGEQWKAVLPVTGVDVVGHSLRVVHYGYMATANGAQSAGNAARPRQGGDERPRSTELSAPDAADDVPYDLNAEAIPGSNTWSIGPSRTTTGNSMLIINPHLSWGETFYRYMTVHVVGPDYDLYGAPQIGFPVAVVGFNRHTGWGRTVNTLQTVFYYRLTVEGDRYRFDGTLRPFERETKVIRIKQGDGSFTEERIEVRRTVHGPVVYDQDGVTLAVRVAGLDRPRMMEQWFRMGEARTFDEFKDALRIGSIPMWNVNYADDQGHIMFVHNGLIARRNPTDPYPSGVLAGDVSATLWNDYLTFDELPKSVDPPSGWNQNANEPPWLMTLPPIDRTKYPTYVAPAGGGQPAMRTLRSLRMITEDPKISYEMLLAKKHSTRMELADRVLPDMIEHARKGTDGGRAAADAMRVLERWDRNADADSRGAVLFQIFANRYLNQGLAAKMRVRYDPQNPVETAYGLADPEAALVALAAAAEETVRLYGSLEVPYGDVYRFRSGNADLPGNGGAGSAGLFRTVTFGRREGNRSYASHGETIVCGIEFARQQQARCLLSYGNASQPGSPHLEDQLPFLARKELLPVWRERGEVEANLKEREGFVR